MDRAGIVGADGPTHHGLLDIAYLRGYPNIILMAPKDEAEMRNMILTAIEYPGPAAIRYPRGSGVGVPMDDKIETLEIGKAEILREGSDVAILGIGSEVSYCVKAAERLAVEGLNVTVVNARFVKPLDSELILALARSHGSIVTAEDHYLMGGFGSAVLEVLSDRGVDVPVRRVGMRDGFDVVNGDRDHLHALYGIDVPDIIRAAAG